MARQPFSPKSISGLQAWYESTALKATKKAPNEVPGLVGWYKADAMVDGTSPDTVSGLVQWNRPEELGGLDPATMPASIKPVAWYKAEDFVPTTYLDANTKSGNVDPTMEQFTGWLANGGLTSVTKDSTRAHTGNFSAKCIGNGAASEPAMYTNPSPAGTFASVNGEDITASCWVYTDTTISAGHLAMYLYDAADANVGSDFSTAKTATAGQWTQWTATLHVTAANTDHIRLAIYFNDGGSAYSGTAWVDDVTLARGRGSQWRDASGNGYHATQATVAAQPMWKDSIINGRPVMRFDGSNDTMVLPAALAALFNSAGTPFSMFAVTKHASTTGDRAELTLTSTTGLGLEYAGITNGTQYGLTRTDDQGTATVNRVSSLDTNADVVSYFWAANSGFTAKNGIGQTNGMGDHGTVTTNQGHIGSRAGTSSFANCDIAEIILFNRTISAVEREQIELYLAAKYAIDYSVATWNAKAGKAATQTTDANKPLRKANVTNGHPSLRFDGTNDAMVAEFGALTADSTIICVTNPTASGVGTYLYDSGAAGEGFRNALAVGTASAGFAYSGIVTNYTQGSGLALNSAIFRAASTDDLWINGSRVSGLSAQNTGAQVMNGLTIGARFSFTGNMTGDFHEIIIYNRALTDLERQGVELYLAKKYGITTAIGQWNDSSGQAKHATQTTDSKKPTLVRNAQNGLPAIRFAAASFHQLDIADHSDFSPKTTGGLFVFAAVKPTDGATGSYFGKASNPYEFAVYHDANNANIMWQSAGGAYLGAVASAPVPGGTANIHVASMNYTGATNTVFTSGVQGSTTNTPAGDMTDTSSPVTIGQRGDATWYYTGDVYELVAIRGSITAADRQALELYLADKWNIPTALTTWNDLAGVAHATQATDGNKPKYVPNALAGRPVVRFDGTDDKLVIATGVVNLNGSCTVFTVVNANNAGAAEVFFEWAVGAGTNQGPLMFDASFRITDNVGFKDSPVWLTNPISARYMLLTGRYTQGGNVEGWTNGVTNGAGTATSGNNPNTLDTFTIGTHGTAGTLPLQGDILEVLAYNRALSDAERAAVENYLKSKYAIESRG